MGGDAFDMVLYLFVLGPAVEWCLKSKRVNGSRPGSRRGIGLAVALLATVAAVRLSADIWGRPENNFSILGLRVDASSSEIKQAYRTISLKHHPDKNPDDPKAAEKFIRYQSAYEVLKDSTQRNKYNKFGTVGASDEAGLGSPMTSMALFYVIWLVVGYLLTMGKASEDARTWAFSGLLALAVFEYQCRILSVDYLAAPLCRIQARYGRAARPSRRIGRGWLGAGCSSGQPGAAWGGLGPDLAPNGASGAPAG